MTVSRSNSARWITAVVGVSLVGAIAYFVVWPAYQNNQVKGQLAEVFMSTDVCKAEIAQTVQKTTAAALSTSLFGCDGGASSGVKISRYLKSIAIGPSGAINVTVDFRSLPELTPTTSTLTVVPLVDATTPLGTGDVRKTIATWRCGSPQDGTTIPSKYLPTNCGG